MPKAKTNTRVPARKNPADFTGEAWSLIRQIMEKTVVTVFWESVDKAEKKVKVTVKMGLKLLLSTVAIFSGLVFLVVGMSQILDQFLSLSPGIGYALFGLIIVIFGLIVLEKLKNEKNNS